MILVLDSRDSFVHNLARYLVDEGARVEVVRSHETTVAEILTARPEGIVLSPGPCTPTEAGVGLELLRDLLGPSPDPGPIPVLGVCLGHQVIGVAAGARLRPARPPRHGVEIMIHRGPDHDPLLGGLPDPFPAGLYHSLSIDPASLPGTLRVSAVDPAGEIMAVRHVDRPIHGVQFHPESILTPDGRLLLRNFLELTR